MKSVPDLSLIRSITLDSADMSSSFGLPVPTSVAPAMICFCTEPIFGSRDIEVVEPRVPSCAVGPSVDGVKCILRADRQMNAGPATSTFRMDD